MGGIVIKVWREFTSNTVNYEHQLLTTASTWCNGGICWTDVGGALHFLSRQ